ncbi:MAG: metallophosphoesterase [Solobacterium sp.]|jgi:predicted MPP superfamily phosphohydrolase|nr:metallophosphoesterase [Solobacterium sp.]MCH4206447.1 metallophosphoesterase [Solobacterium sp.]MCH4227942.1 metallophosphoesterase [Solobacterium sp.]MCH4283372.1 metallophosphoesterase [Solobacterium sp.]
MSAWVIYLLYVLLNAYAVWQTFVLMKRIIAKKWPAVLSAVFLVLMGIIPVLAINWSQAGTFRNQLQGFANIWLGFILIYMAALLIFQICRLCSRKKEMNAKHALISLVICLVISIGMNVYGTHTAHTIYTSNYTVSLNESDYSEHGKMKIVLIADLHLGVNSSISQLEDMVQKINEQDADLVLIGGDIFNSTYDGLTDPDRQAEILSQIQTKYGVYGVWGNHDVVEPLLCGFALTPPSQAFRSADMVQFMKDANITMLEDEMTTVNGIQIVGRKDREKAGDGTEDRESTKDVLSQVNADQPVIVLQHEPKDFEEMAEYGADLALCGHTHDGQIFPGNILVSLMYENSCGEKMIQGMDTIVTSGVGYYGPPLRIGTKSEIAVIDLSY